MNQTTTGRWLRQNGAIIVFLDPASARRAEVDSESALKTAWANQAIRRVHRGSNAYKEDQLPNRYGFDGLGLNPEREEEEFRAVDLPNKVKEAFARGPLAWPAVVQRAIEAGIRDSAKLASIVFFLHHSERDGRALDSNEPNFKKLSEEWKAWRTLNRANHVEKNVGCVRTIDSRFWHRVARRRADQGQERTPARGPDNGDRVQGAKGASA